MMTAGRGASEPDVGERPLLGVLDACPRQGTSTALAREVERGVSQVGLASPSEASEDGDDARGVELTHLRLRDHRILPCVGCDACSSGRACPLGSREGHDAPGFEDLARWMEGLDALVIVSPIYFAGPPATLKAALDRMQVFWARRYVLGTRPPLALECRRPLGILAVGSGGDPFGHEPLVTCVRSAMRMLDFELCVQGQAVGSNYASDGSLAPRAVQSAREVGLGVARALLERGRRL